jgi:hypothetical protein
MHVDRCDRAGISGAALGNSQFVLIEGLAGAAWGERVWLLTKL